MCGPCLLLCVIVVPFAMYQNKFYEVNVGRSCDSKQPQVMLLSLQFVPLHFDCTLEEIVVDMLNLQVVSVRLT